MYNGKDIILGFALKHFYKPPNESVIECIGSVTKLCTKPQRNWFGSLGTFLRSAHFRLELKAMAIGKPKLQPKAVHIVAVLL